LKRKHLFVIFISQDCPDLPFLFFFVFYCFAFAAHNTRTTNNMGKLKANNTLLKIGMKSISI